MTKPEIKEFPKKVKDPDGNLIKAANKVQEECILKGKPFPAEEVKPEKKKEGPKEYPKNIEVTVEGEDGEETTERRVVSCKEEEHAVRNGEEWAPEADAVVEATEKKEGPAEYPKVLMIDGDRVKVRNKAEELAALGEVSDDETDGGDGGEDGIDRAALLKMTKDGLEEHVLEKYGIDLNKSFTKENMVKQLEEELAKQDDEGGEDDAEVILEDMSEEELVVFGKENYELELDVESGKEALIEAIVEAAEDDLGLDD